MMVPEQNDKRCLIDIEQKIFWTVVLSKHTVICLAIRRRAVATILSLQVK